MLGRVAVVGAGSWGTTMTKVMAQNITKISGFSKDVTMWMYEETYEGKKLTDIVNNEHVNPRYLPGIPLPPNLYASSNLKEVVDEASHLIFVVPHQFVPNTIKEMKPYVRKDAVGISLVKGLMEMGDRIQLLSEFINDGLGIHMSVLSGANIALEVAKEDFGETTVACDRPDVAQFWKKLFETDYLRVGLVEKCFPVEICGAVKNCIALASGFVTASGYGHNTNAAIIRIGLKEIMDFCQLYRPFDDHLMFYESFGVADLITTCSGGRNSRVASAYVKTGKDFFVLEKELLNGQKLQGPGTLKHVHAIIKKNNLEAKFPLLMGTYGVVFENKPVQSMLDLLKLS